MRKLYLWFMGLGTKVFVIIGMGLLLAVLLTVWRCSQEGQIRAQAGQDARSAEATNNAAEVAVETVAARAGIEAELDDIVDAATEEIENAEGSDQIIHRDVADAARRAACRLPAYRNDPACRMLAANP